MDCPGGPDLITQMADAFEASTLVLMDCPGGLYAILGGSLAVVLQPLF